jgi:hypothetical protein
MIENLLTNKIIGKFDQNFINFFYLRQHCKYSFVFPPLKKMRPLYFISDMRGCILWL